MTRVLVTGGAGFIGSHFVRHLLAPGSAWEVINLDKLTYAGNLDNLRDVERDPRYRFLRGDIGDRELVTGLLGEVAWAVNFAAETHVDRSIQGADAFLATDVLGTHALLEGLRAHPHVRFLQISTDEVYGPVAEGALDEGAPLRPSSPYAASKAGGDCLVHAYGATYGLDVRVLRATNNFGPCQHPEKFIPLVITNALEDLPIPIYGDGRQRRDWLSVEDCARAARLVLERGAPGEVYHVAGAQERENRAVAEQILAQVGKPASLLRRVTDRPGHDRRYALDCAKLRALGWAPERTFEEALGSTVAWYRAHADWWRKVRGPDFARYFREQYPDLAG